MKRLIIYIILFIFAFGGSAQNYLYVIPGGMGDGLTPSTPTDLQTALNAAISNGADDEILIAEGVYTSTPYNIILTGGDGMDITLTGTWSPDFTGQSFDPSSTALDGSFTTRVLNIDGSAAGVTMSFNMNYLTVRNGVVNGANGAGMNIECGSDEQGSVISTELNSVSFQSNIINSGGSGGALFTEGPMLVSSCEFVDNEAGNGGAILSTHMLITEAGQRRIEDSYFEGNYNFGNQGSTIYTAETLEIYNTEIAGELDGSSSGNGSAIYGSTNCHLIIDRCIFHSINIPYWGGAIQVWDGDMDLTNSLFYDIQVGSTSGYGGAFAYYHNNGSGNDHELNMVNCTVYDCTANVGFFGAVHFRGDAGDDMNIFNCVFDNNGNNPIYAESGNAQIGYSNSEFGPTGFTEVTTTDTSDPMLDLENDYRPMEGSPCIDQGSNEYLNGMTVDLSGYYRVLGETVDMGCYEFNAAPEGIETDPETFDENNIASTAVVQLGALGQTGDDHSFDFQEGDGTNDADNDLFSIDSNNLILNESANYEVKSEYYIYLRATDSQGQSIDQALVISVNDINDAPVAENPIDDQQGMVDELFEFTLGNDLFSDEDEGDELILSATLEDDSPLPAWLSFNSETLTFSGTPVSEGLLNVKVIATDLGGATAESLFELNILPVGIDELSGFDLRIYPNPASEVIYLSTNIAEQFRCIITDQTGRRVFDQVLRSGTSPINVSQLQAGHYILNIWYENHMSTVRFIKQ